MPRPVEPFAKLRNIDACRDCRTVQPIRRPGPISRRVSAIRPKRLPGSAPAAHGSGVGSHFTDDVAQTSQRDLFVPRNECGGSTRVWYQQVRFPRTPTGTESDSSGTPTHCRRIWRYDALPAIASRRVGKRRSRPERSTRLQSVPSAFGQVEMAPLPSMEGQELLPLQRTRVRHRAYPPRLFASKSTTVSPSFAGPIDPRPDLVGPDAGHRIGHSTPGVRVGKEAASGPISPLTLPRPPNETRLRFFARFFVLNGAVNPLAVRLIPRSGTLRLAGVRSFSLQVLQHHAVRFRPRPMFAATVGEPDNMERR